MPCLHVVAAAQREAQWAAELNAWRSAACCPPCCAGRHDMRRCGDAGGGESRQVLGICLPGCQTPIIHLLQRFGSTRCRPACARAQVPWQDGTRSSHRLRPPAIDVPCAGPASCFASAIDAVQRRHPEPDVPLALVTSPLNAGRCAVDPAAQAQGLQRGMPVSGRSVTDAGPPCTATCTLKLDADTFDMLAAWAYGFSSRVGLRAAARHRAGDHP